MERLVWVWTFKVRLSSYYILSDYYLSRLNMLRFLWDQFCLVGCEWKKSSFMSWVTPDQKVLSFSAMSVSCLYCGNCFWKLPPHITCRPVALARKTKFAFSWWISGTLSHGNSTLFLPRREHSYLVINQAESCGSSSGNLTFVRMLTLC